MLPICLYKLKRLPVLLSICCASLPSSNDGQMYWNAKIMHHFSNAFNMVLTLNFCILKVTDVIAFKFYADSLSLIKVRIAVCKGHLCLWREDSLVLTLNFCILKVTDVIAFKFYADSLSLIKVRIADCKGHLCLWREDSLKNKYNTKYYTIYFY